jgi:hypothetical protein
MFGNIIGALTGSSAQGNYQNAANQFGNAAQSYNPYIQRGNTASEELMRQYGQLVSDPNHLQDQIAKGFQLSPYQQNLLNQTTSRSNMNAANSGMQFSPEAQRALNEQINNQTGQFQNDYVNRGVGTYGMGLQGYQGMNQMGFQAQGAKNDLMTQQIGSQLRSDQAPTNAANHLIGLGTGVGMSYLMGGFGKGADAGDNTAGGAPMAQGYNYANPAANYLNPWSSTYQF